MNILLLTDYYYPVIKSGSVIMGDLASELINQKHKVTIITFDSSQKEFLTMDTHNGAKIIRLSSPSRDFGMVGRLFAELNYSRKIKKALSQTDRNLSFDGIICFSPSIFYGKAIDSIKKQFQIKAYLICRDIFPKWTLDAGILSEGPLYWYFKSIEKALYKSIDFIGIESKYDKDYFAKYLSYEKIEVLDNWGSTLRAVKESDKSDVFDNNKVNILYGGNMAEAQDLLSLIQIIDDSILDDKAVLTLIGSGHQLESIKTAARRKKLKNINILPEVDNSTYLSILSKADIGLVSLNKELKSNNFPLKMMGYLQLGKPILASVNSSNEIIELINKNNIGLVSTAGDRESFNKNLSLIINDRELRKIQGENGLKIFNDRFTVYKAVQKIIHRIE